MRAFLIDSYTPADGGRIADVPEPEPAAGQVLVRVRAAGVNVLDTKIRSGEFKLILPYPMPFVLGHDVAGDVVAVGPGVRRFNVGDEVYARPRTAAIGTFAELIAMDETDVALKPTTLSMVEAASVPLVGLTAWQALVERAKVQPGDKVLIEAGSGGVGTIAIQLAKHLGATVATTTGAASFALRKAMRVLKRGGRVISISGPPDPRFAAEIGAPWFIRPAVHALSAPTRCRAKRHGVDYSFLFMRADGTQLAEITALIDDGTIRPVVDKTFPFEATRDALASVEVGRTKGKVVVTMS